MSVRFFPVQKMPSQGIKVVRINPTGFEGGADVSKWFIKNKPDDYRKLVDIFKFCGIKVGDVLHTGEFLFVCTRNSPYDLLEREIVGKVLDKIEKTFDKFGVDDVYIQEELWEVARGTGPHP